MLFGKLQQGVVENQQVLQIAKLRAEAEDLYGNRLTAIPTGVNKNGGFGKDDGASVRKVCATWNPDARRSGVLTECDRRRLMG